MATLTQLLGNREQAWEDNLEKGRIYVYTEGNMYTGFCNGFCWKPPGCGIAVIEAWGAAGSGAEMCCCGTGLPGNAPSYLKKCICVCPANFIRGSIGRSCNNSDDLCFRGCSQASCICWTGCAPRPLYGDGYQRDFETSWKGNNPWGWGNAIGEDLETDHRGENNITRVGDNNITNSSICCATGASAGCLCAQGARGGVSYCIDDKSAYSCFVTNYHCGQAVGPGMNMCRTAGSSCGRICHFHPANFAGNSGFMACAFGGDLNCCGMWSCSDFLGCLQTCPCQFMFHVPTAAGVFAEEGATVSFFTDGDTTQWRWSGGPQGNFMNAVPNLSRSPGHLAYAACWVGAVGCGCYNMNGCMNFMPYGVPGAPAQPCGEVRDHAGRGGMGLVRIKYISTDGGGAY